jgi:hypothetical protein
MRCNMENGTQSILDVIRAKLAARASVTDGLEESPLCVLWPDRDRQWEPALPRLMEGIPELIALGPYAPPARTGPAIWIRCTVARALSDPKLPNDRVPVVYLPGVSRDDLKNITEMAGLLQPLAYLQFIGVIWNHPNNKDWSINALLSADVKHGGLGLDVATDRTTQESMRRAVKAIVDEPLERLRKGRLEAVDFDKLLISDVDRQVLAWMVEPNAEKQRLSDVEWRALVNTVKAELDFDIEKKTNVDAAERLGSSHPGGPWDQVWQTYAIAPDRYGPVRDLLKAATPPGLFGTGGERWPGVNEQAEQNLRESLAHLANQAVKAIRDELPKLSQMHTHRTSWVWARLGEARLCQALEALQIVADLTAKSLGGISRDGMAEQYTQVGWQVDDAVLRAVDCVRSDADLASVSKIVRAMYLPWLDDAAKRLQAEVIKNPLPSPQDQAEFVTDLPPGTCVLFVDGLRYDLANRLAGKLTAKSLKASVGWRWSTIPSVTPSAKPAVSPLAKLLGGKVEATVAKDFAVCIIETQDTLNTDRFAKLLAGIAVQSLKAPTTGDPTGKAWTEIGDVDRRGHDEGIKLAWRIEEELDRVMERVLQLIAAGWSEIRIVTDHGWLLCPDGLPVMDEKKYIAETKWGRCMAIGESNKAHGIGLQWSWKNGVQIDIAPGATVFYKGNGYAHGSVSPQEIVAPTIRVTALVAKSVRITNVKWIGMRCQVTIECSEEGMTLDLWSADAPMKSLQAEPMEGVAAPIPVNLSGPTRLFARDDVAEGDIVVLDAAGSVLTRQTVTIPK